MTTRKRNEWLEDDLSEDDGSGYDSEAAEESRSKVLDRRTTKRRKVNGSEDSESDDEDAPKIDDEEEAQEDEESNHPDEANLDDNDAEPEQVASPKTLTAKKTKALSSKSLAKSQAKASRTGVIYLSRVPPFMKPQAIRSLLSPYGEIGRVFLTPEDPAAHTRRVKNGGNKKRSFTDGWVEFMNKEHAKIVAESLNTNIIGGKKGGWYHDDVWNIKYLKGFKWHHLTEQISNENAERAARLRTEIAQTTRENKLFLDNVERAKMLEGMEAKKKKKLQATDTAEEPVIQAPSIGKKGAYKQQFRQNEVKLKGAKSRGKTEQSADVKRVLSKIF